jgi:hypothetical protein
MIESFKDLTFEGCKTEEDADARLQEKLGLTLKECKEALSNSLLIRAEEVVPDLPSVAPYGDYDKLMEDPEAIQKFLEEEAFKEENWEIVFFYARKEQDKLAEFVFYNKSVDDGDILKGFVYVGISGKIRHAFVQASS